MAIQVQGAKGTIADVDGTAFNAAAVTIMPTDPGALGSYRVSVPILMQAAQAANGTLFSFRWGDPVNFAVISYIKLACLQTAAATATIWPAYQVFTARSFTASDTGGQIVWGSTGLVRNNNMKKRLAYPASSVFDIRYTTATAGLTVGTRSLDTDPILEVMTQQTITTVNQKIYQKELNFRNAGDMPLILAQDEGFIVRGPTTIFGAAGTANLAVEVAWSEVPAY